MRRVNAFNFCELGRILSALEKLPTGNTTLGVIVWDLMTGVSWVDSMLAGNLGVSLSFCKPSAEKLRNAILYVEPLLGTPGGIAKANFQKPLEYHINGVYQVVDIATELKTVLRAELQAADTYTVSKKGIYATADLIDVADNILPEVARESVSIQVTHDVRQAGRCLAFECPTAAGFHLLRATEGVLQQYFQTIVGDAPKPRLRNWGFYLKRLRQPEFSPNERVLKIIDQIRETHRNPVMHPDENLTTEEATILLGIVVSAIVAMTQDTSARKAAREKVA
jgi:hypothetical protein